MFKSRMLAFCLLMLSGCAGYRDPLVTVSGASVGESSDEALRLDFDLNLGNPNDQSLRLSEFEYVVLIDGKKVYDGTRAAEATLASNDDRQQRIPAIVRYDALGWSAGNLPPSIRYELKGKLLYVAPGELFRTLRELGFPPPSAKFSQSDEIALR